MRVPIIIITILVTISIILCYPIYAVKVNYAGGLYAGFMPSMGGNLDSYVQQNYLHSDSGIDGINVTTDGASTSNIERLTGATVGAEFKAIFYDFYLVRTAINASMGVNGGEGTTLYTPDNINYYYLDCSYSLMVFDVPLTIGLSIPFWKDMKISISCGIAYAYAIYENKFTSNETSPAFERKGEFKGWGLPLVILLEGEYFITEKISMVSILSYYRGSTKIIKDSTDSDTDGLDVDSDGTPDGVVDFSKIDFTGYRFSFGISYYIHSI